MSNTSSSPPTSSLPPLNLQNYPDVRESYIESIDLTYHILSAGDPKQPLILCLHGFPELAYSYRKILGPIAAAGYHVVAFDQRGYGRTTGWDTRDFNNVDLNTFRFSNIIRDAVVLVKTLGYEEVACVIGNDFGGFIAPWCALTRPDIFKSVVVMTHPFKGAPKIPQPSSSSTAQPQPTDSIHQTLANLTPPRKHYKWYYATSPAASELLGSPSTFKTFYRGYYHLKSADWSGNHPTPLKAWNATELSQLPLYYIMPLHSTMHEAVSEESTSSPPDATVFSRWLPDDELDVYVREFTRTGFQGGLNWYRVQTEERLKTDLQLWTGGKVQVPVVFISGTKDWGAYQEPGALEEMAKVCVKWKGAHFVDGAGHWVQQEQPEKVIKLVLNFLSDLDH